MADIGAILGGVGAAIAAGVALYQTIQKGRISSLEERSKALEVAQKEIESMNGRIVRLEEQDREKDKTIAELKAENQNLRRFAMLEEVPPALKAILEQQSREIRTLVETVKNLISTVEEVIAARVSGS